MICEENLSNDSQGRHRIKSECGPVSSWRLSGQSKLPFYIKLIVILQYIMEPTKDVTVIIPAAGQINESMVALSGRYSAAMAPS